MKAVSYLLPLFLLLLSLVSSSCGYHSPYSDKIDKTSKNTSVYIRVWKNNTNELGFEGEIFQRINDWLQESKHLTITSKKDQADLLLSGSIDSVDFPATAFSDSDRATTLKARVKTSYQLVRRETGEKIKQTQNTVREVSYGVGSDAVRTRSNKENALASIANEIGEQIYLEVFYTLTGYQK